MLVQMKNGNVEDLYDHVAKSFIQRGLAVAITPEGQILKAEEQGVPVATVGIEVAMLEPKQEHAVVKYIRTLRSRIGV
jgi:hypothetical protein